MVPSASFRKNTPLLYFALGVVTGVKRHSTWYSKASNWRASYRSHSCPWSPVQVNVRLAESTLHCCFVLTGLSGGIAIRVQPERFGPGSISIQAGSAARSPPDKRTRLRNNRMRRLEVFSFTQRCCFRTRNDVAQESAEHRACAHLEPAVHSPLGEQLHRGGPAHGIWDLLIQTFARFNCRSYFSRLP